MVKKYAFAIAIAYTLLLTIVSLVQVNATPDLVPRNGDKLVHFLLYSIMAFVWANLFLKNYKYKKQLAILWASILSVLFGIIIEVLQEHITLTRAFDLNDIFANGLGVLFMAVILIIKTKRDVKNI